MAGLNKYQAYPEYRDSGMEWCNELPLNWKKTKLRWLSNIFAGGTPPKMLLIIGRMVQFPGLVLEQ